MSSPRGWGEPARPQIPARGPRHEPTPAGEPAPGPGVAPPGAPEPGPVDGERPAMGVGELMDRVIGTIRTAPRSIWLFGVVVVAIVGAVELLAGRLLPTGSLTELLTSGLGGSPVPEEAAQELQVLTGQVLTSALASVVGAVATTVVVGWTARALALAASSAAAAASPAPSDGARADARTTWRALRPRIGGLVALMMLAAVLVAGALALPALLAVLASTTGSAGLVAGAAVVGAALGVTALLRWAPAVVISLPEQATADGRGGAGTALARATALVAGERWRLAGIWLLAVIVLTITGGVVSAPFSGIGALTGGDAQVTWSLIGSVIASAVTAPLGALVLAIVHRELSERRGTEAGREH